MRYHDAHGTSATYTRIFGELPHRLLQHCIHKVILSFVVPAHHPPRHHCGTLQSGLSSSGKLAADAERTKQM